MNTKTLENRINYLNKICQSNEGSFGLEQSYGGNKLVFIKNDSGQRDMLNTGLTTKKNLYTHINAFIDGLEWNKYNK